MTDQAEPQPAVDYVRQVSTRPAAVAYRARIACDIFEGFTDGIDGDRLGELARWTMQGRALDDAALLRAFAAPWIAAAEESGWEGDPEAEARKDIKRHTLAAAALDEGAAGERSMLIRAHVAWMAALAKLPDDVEVVMTTEQAQTALKAAIQAAHPSPTPAADADRVRIAVEGVVAALDFTVDRAVSNEDGHYDLPPKLSAALVALAALKAAAGKTAS